ncbi:MAG TPA: glucan 1,4-alpha-glucosidase [Chitinophagaceae bacterium]|nr:glucan 1,4-alpha-glucosidase [Chitinophagaceae bacterium]
MTNKSINAPGAPGLSARWTSSAKEGIGKALSATSNVCFTLSHGILNEIYFPREDDACTRDMGLIVTDGKTFFSEEKRNTSHITSMLEEGIPAYHIMNGCKDGRYSIEKEVITDPCRNVVLQQIRFKPLIGKKKDYKLFALLAPHVGNSGGGNTAWIDEYKGIPMLFASRGGLTLAFACSVPWERRSVGFVGQSDGWNDLHKHKQMTWEYQCAENGNVALTGQIDLEAVNDTFLLAIGFGRNKEEAALHAWSSIISGFEETKKNYMDEWREWQKSITHTLSSKNAAGKLFRASAAILRMHEGKQFQGGMVASMSIPWGFDKGDNDIGGYHLVWPRDLVESSGGLLAIGAQENTLRILNYLIATQEADGSWPQNMWMEGKRHWKGIQMDEIALPILLIDLCKEKGVLKSSQLPWYWESVKRAAAFLIQNGPSSPQDRWEEESGLTPFTMATEISALLAAADFAERNNEHGIALYCRETADDWNERIEEWIYVTDTNLAKECWVEGYYIRINPYNNVAANDLHGMRMQVKNRPPGEGSVQINELVCPDALALVRFGLRAADDPRILNTIKVIDKMLKVDTPTGPCWHRYNEDGYGEEPDGGAYDGSGVGRAWPLLTGERAHYEIAAGHMQKARALVKTMESFAENGLISEQIWDKEDIPDKELYFGRPSGSAMPLVWAQAEYIKLCASLKLKEVFDMPEYTKSRYIDKNTKAKYKVWRFEQPYHVIEKGKILRIATRIPATIHWSLDNWETTEDIDTVDSGLGTFIADLPKMTKKGRVVFTFYWKKAKHWENKNFEVEVKGK